MSTLLPLLTDRDHRTHQEYDLASEDSQSVDGFAVSRVAPEFQGPCRVTYAGSGGEFVAVLPNYTAAVAVALYAVGNDGGYWRATVDDAESLPVTHQDLVAWISD